MNKIEAIRSEIERRSNLTSDTTAGRELDEILSFIDSLPEEPMEILADKCKMDETPAPDNWEPVDVGDLIIEPQESSEGPTVPTYYPVCCNGGACTNPHHDCINCPHNQVTIGINTQTACNNENKANNND